LSIKPEYASAIFRGEKQFEYRRMGFQQQLDVIVLYVTTPVQRVVGEFDVSCVIRDDVANLWERTKSAAGIDEAGFFDYFAGKDEGYAIEIGERRIYEEPLDVEKHFGMRPPQSFAYLDFPWPVQRTTP
jgi:predicted transcriptional regulator